MFAGKHQAAALVVEGNPQRLASVAFSALEGLPRVAQLKQRLRQPRQKTTWSLNFDVNAFDFIGGKGGEVYLAQSWQPMLHADSRWLARAGWSVILLESEELQ